MKKPVSGADVYDDCMKRKLLACSIACAVLFAESAAALTVSADAAAKPVRAGTSAVQAAEDNDTEPEQKKVGVSAYQITDDNVKILLYTKELNPDREYYSSVLGYMSSYMSGNEEIPEDSVLVSDWFLSEDGFQRVDRYSRLLSDRDHSVYYMKKAIPLHYLHFNAGEGTLVWENSKKLSNCNAHDLADDETAVAEQGTLGSRMPKAEWGDRAFLGWFTAPEGGEQITGSTVITGEKEQTLYAHWGDEGSASPRNTYYVSMFYVGTDGEVSFSNIRTVNKGDSYGKIFSYMASPVKAASSASSIKDQYEPGTAAVYDWYTEKDGGMIVNAASTEKVPGDTAIYNRKGVFACHYISFDAGEGELFWNASNNTPYYEGNVEAAKPFELIAMEDHTVSALPSAEYGTHAFLGWFTAPEGGTQFDTQTVYKEKGNLKLYVHWGEAGSTEAPKGIKVRIYNMTGNNGEVRSAFDYRGEDCANYNEIIYGKIKTITKVLPLPDQSRQIWSSRTVRAIRPRISPKKRAAKLFSSRIRFSKMKTMRSTTATISFRIIMQSLMQTADS